MNEYLRWKKIAHRLRNKQHRERNISSTNKNQNKKHEAHPTRTDNLQESSIFSKETLEINWNLTRYQLRQRPIRWPEFVLLPVYTDGAWNLRCGLALLPRNAELRWKKQL